MVAEKQSAASTSWKHNPESGLTRRFILALQSLALRVGFVIERSTLFHREIANLYCKKQMFTFLQVGAYDGVSFDTLYWLVQKYNGHGVAIEPLPDLHERLNKNYQWIETVKTICCAVHSNSTSITMYRVANDLPDVPVWARGSSSFDVSHLINAGIPKDSIRQESVVATHLMQLIHENGLLELDVLQVDAEGYDHDVLRMLDFASVKPRIIKYEHTKRVSPQTLSDEAEIRNWLRSHNYKVRNDGPDVVAVLK